MLRKTIAKLYSKYLILNLLFKTDFLSNANISYFWFINGTNYGSTNGSSFEYNLKIPSVSQIEAFVYTYIPEKMSKLQELEIERNRSYEFFKNYSARYNELTESSPMIYNRFSTYVNARTPMTYIKHTGKSYLTKIRRNMEFKSYHINYQQ